MIFPLRAPRWALLPQRIRGVFNLNDPRWGRGESLSVEMGARASLNSQIAAPVVQWSAPGPG